MATLTQCDGQLVRIVDYIPNAQIDMRYKYYDNVTGHVIYEQEQACLLRQHVAQALRNVQDELTQYGLGIKIWDAYRPVYAQWKLWDSLSDNNFVSDPSVGFHTRGTAVDLTLVDLKSGAEVTMPTEFDAFCDQAAADYAGDGLSYEAYRNRELLKHVMEKHGFRRYDAEWWHFNYRDWQDWPQITLQRHGISA